MAIAIAKEQNDASDCKEEEEKEEGRKKYKRSSGSITFEYARDLFACVYAINVVQSRSNAEYKMQRGGNFNNH